MTKKSNITEMIKKKQLTNKEFKFMLLMWHNDNKSKSTSEIETLSEKFPWTWFKPSKKTIHSMINKMLNKGLIELAAGYSVDFAFKPYVQEVHYRPTIKREEIALIEFERIFER